MATMWLSDTKCDFCGRDATEQGESFVDGKTMFGPWALMCQVCWAKVGIGKLGTGFGQRYNSKTLIKVEG